MLENIILDILDRYKGYIFWIIYKKKLILLILT
jgi:hypothetical protein